MGDYDFTVGDLNLQIKKQGKMNIAQLGSTTADQNTYIYYYMTQALWKYAGIIFRKRTSSPLVVATNGYVTFQHSGVDITDMYAPMKIISGAEVSGRNFNRRASFDDTSNGWFKESANDQIHIKGAGTYVLQYRAYHAKIISDSQSLDMPQAAYRLIQYETLALIFNSLNDIENASLMMSIADKEIPILILANMESSSATTGGIVPTQNSVQYYRR